MDPVNQENGSQGPLAATTSAPPSSAGSAQEPNDFKLLRPLSGPAPRPDLPESYFTPTTADLKAAQTALAARTQALTNAPLQTSNMREAVEKPKRERWPNTTIRIKFLDGYQLEKVFPSTSKIKPIYAFVRSCLREDVKPHKFILYTPPKRELKVSDPNVRDLSLYDLQLTPSSVLLIKFIDEELNHAHLSSPLSEFVISKAEDLPLPPNFDEDESPSGSNPTAKKATGSSLSSSGIMGDKKIPKWLKIGKK